MTAAELIAIRQSLGLTPDQFAAELGVPPHSYAGWEEGTVRIDDRSAREITYRGALAERQAALKASGLPECEWLRAWEAESRPEKLKRIERVEALESHLVACATCRAREEFLAERFGPMPEPPLPGWLRLIGRVNDIIARLPAWARPAAWGALALLLLTMLRVVFALPTLARQPHNILVLLGAVLVAMAGGAAGGLVYSFIGRPLRRVRVAGPYLAGIATVLGYVLSIALGAAAVGEAMIENRAELMVFLLVSVFFGLILGHSLFRKRPR